MDCEDCRERWFRWSIRGTEADIARVLDRIDSTLPAGWRRLDGEELAAHGPLVQPGAAWYVTEGAHGLPGATVCLETMPGSLNGGRIWFPSPAAHDGDTATGWGCVMRLLDETIVPAGRSVGAKIFAPMALDLVWDDVPSEIRSQLERMAVKGEEGLWQSDSWRDFVIAVFRSETRFDFDRLRRWLTSRGWTTEATERLLDRLPADHELISRYRDTLCIR